MFGRNYNISICQILESERRTKLSNILKLYLVQDSKFETSLKEFVKTFSCEMEPHNAESLQTDLSTYSSILQQNFDFSRTTEIRQSLAFIAGYAVHSICKSKLYSKEVISNFATSLGYNCVSLLTHDESFALECEDSDLILIHLADRGLKYPSDEVINAVITPCKIFYRIEQNNRLMRQFLAGTSKLYLSNSKFQG